MSESKIDATDRMRREGRLEAFNLRRDEIRTELKGAGKKRQEFRLKASRRVRGKVVGPAGEPVPGACVVLNRWHVHTDRAGFFHWSVEAPVPELVAVKVHKRYTGPYKLYQATVALSQLESQLIVLEK